MLVETCPGPVMAAGRCSTLMWQRSCISRTESGMDKPAGR